MKTEEVFRNVFFLDGHIVLKNWDSSPWFDSLGGSSFSGPGSGWICGAAGKKWTLLKMKVDSLVVNTEEFLDQKPT